MPPYYLFNTIKVCSFIRPLIPAIDYSFFFPDQSAQKLISFINHLEEAAIGFMDFLYFVFQFIIFSYFILCYVSFSPIFIVPYGGCLGHCYETFNFFFPPKIFFLTQSKQCFQIQLFNDINFFSVLFQWHTINVFSFFFSSKYFISF